MSLATLKAKVAQLIEKAQNGGGDLEKQLANELTEFSSDILTLPDYAFYKRTNLKSISMPLIKKLSPGSFGECHALEEVYLPLLEDTSNASFMNCKALKKIELPNVTNIGNSALQSCTSLTQVSIPKVKNIYSYGFSKCTALTEIYLPDTILSIHSTTFNGCTNLLDIYVPWDEGAVANAPWGATNATIHYNHTAEV